MLPSRLKRHCVSIRPEEGGRTQKSAELGIALAEMIRRNKVHAVVCTGANLEEDIFNLVAHDHYFTKDAIGKLSAIIRNLVEKHDCVRAAEFRDHVGAGRKLAIQILEFFDRIGYTRRTGDEHRLREGNLVL